MTASLALQTAALPLGSPTALVPVQQTPTAIIIVALLTPASGIIPIPAMAAAAPVLTNT